MCIAQLCQRLCDLGATSRTTKIALLRDWSQACSYDRNHSLTEIFPMELRLVSVSFSHLLTDDNYIRIHKLAQRLYPIGLLKK